MSAKVNDSQIASGPQTYCYIWDQKSGKTSMFSMATSGFNLIRQTADKLPLEEIPEFESVTIHFLRKFYDSDSIKIEHTQIPLIIAALAGTIKLPGGNEQFNHPGHFITLNYYSKKDDSYMLRAFFIPDSRKAPLPPNILMAHIDNVMSVDVKNRPDWFE